MYHCLGQLKPNTLYGKWVLKKGLLLYRLCNSKMQQRALQMPYQLCLCEHCVARVLWMITGRMPVACMRLSLNQLLQGIPPGKHVDV